MPPRGSRGGYTRGRGAAAVAQHTPMLGKRKAEEDLLPPKRGGFDHQSSFSNFVAKRSEVISRLLEEKGVTEETCEEHFSFKSEEWVEKKHRSKKGGPGSKYTRNLKQICANDPSADQLGSYNSIDGGISVKKAIKYCDFTGFHTSYQDPKTSLRYFNNDFYPYVKTIPDGVKDEYLSLRKANVILK